jgi:hypothetical protein
MGIGMAIGLAMGALLGFAFLIVLDKPGLFSVGLSTGIGAGVAIGAGLNERNKKRTG